MSFAKKNRDTVCPACDSKEHITRERDEEFLREHMTCDCGYIYCAEAGDCFELMPGDECGYVWRWGHVKELTIQMISPSETRNIMERYFGMEA
jgi:hypothetical protein